MSFTLNVVYTPGTVSLLSFMLHSLLHWTDCSFRLVSNACLPPEQRFLRSLCSKDDRLEFWALPTTRIWPHGLVLNYLHALTSEEYFGFLDSDIFATGKFLPHLTAHLTDCAAVFTGAPVWSGTTDQVMPQDFQLASGPYNRTETGVHIGGTYFAIYNNQMLTELLGKEGIGFDEYTWDDVPATWREPLANVGLAKRSYDTGKLLNALLVTQGHSLRYVDAPNLLHLGGTSFVPLSSRRSRWWADLPGVSSLRRLWVQRALHDRFARSDISAAEIQAETTVRLAQRNVVRQHFWQLLRALAANQSPPPLPVVDDLEIQQKLTQAVDSLISAHEQFAGSRTNPIRSPLFPQLD